MKKTLLVLTILTLMICVCGCKNKESKKENSDNLNEKINQEYILNDFKISDIELTYENGISTYKAIVTNIGQEEKETQNFNVILKENENEIVTLSIVMKGIQDTLSINESIEVTSLVEMDLRNVNSITYELK